MIDFMKHFILIGALLSFNAFADCRKQIEILAEFEDFVDHCYKDNRQWSAGFGSGNLCKDMNATGRKTITEKEAFKYLTKEFQTYKKTTQRIGFKGTEAEICTLTTLVYNKGGRNIKKSGFVQTWNEWKRVETAEVKEAVMQEALQMSCSKQNERWVFVNGLFIRQVIVLKMLFGNYHKASEHEQLRSYIDNNEIELKNRFKKYCNDKNRTTKQLMDELIEKINLIYTI